MITTDFAVAGMTCEHCVRAVTEQLSAIEGVVGVAVDLDGGGTSTVHVTADPVPTQAQVSDALVEAGSYRLVGAS